MGERLRRELPGIVALCAAVLFNAVCLAPELDVGRLPLNDGVLHRAAAERLLESFHRGEPFLDPWVSEWSLGYPFWRTYQPLPHLLLAGLFALTQGWADAASAFAAAVWALLTLLPASTYLGARMLGLGPPAAGLAALLVLTPNGSGELGAYGLGYGAYVWRGSGLFTQLVAIHLLVLSLGSTRRALDRGDGRLTAAVLLTATALSHIVAGYVAFVSATLLAVVGPRRKRSLRCVRLATVALPGLVLLLWFLVPISL